MFTAGDNTIRLKKDLCKETASAMRGRNGWSWLFSRGGRQPSGVLTHCHASLGWKQLNGELSHFDLSTVVNGNAAPALGDPLASCQVVFVYTVLICAHVWCISGTFSVTLWMFLKSCEAPAFICVMIFYRAAQLHFIVKFMSSNTYLTQTGSTGRIVARRNTSNSTQIHFKYCFSKYEYWIM